MNSKFIKSQHPKSSVKADREIFEKMEKMGWWGQRKMGVGSNGLRSQIHLDSKGVVAHYTRQGTRHTRRMSANIHVALENLKPDPESGITVLDGEWVPQLDKLFVFDVLMYQSEKLNKLTYEQRYDYILAFSDDFEDSYLGFLPVYRTASYCMKELAKIINDKYCEGFVFRSPTSTGWNDTSIIRCRVKGYFKDR